MEFTEDQILRYSRHILLPEVGGDGQEKLLNAKVVLVGAGGLGSPVGYYLAAAGVGTIGVIDNDRVEISNLQRQIAHNTKRLGVLKADSAKETYETLNHDVKVVTHKERLTSANIKDIIKDYDIVVDGSDNFPTRYLVNDACVMLKKTLMSAAVFRFEGQVMTIYPGRGALLPLPLRGPAARRHGAVLPGSGHPRRGDRRDRDAPGHRGDQGDPRHRRAAQGEAAALERARYELPDREGAAEPGMPGLRRASDDHGTDRLRAVLLDEPLKMRSHGVRSGDDAERSANSGQAIDDADDIQETDLQTIIDHCNAGYPE